MALAHWRSTRLLRVNASLLLPVELSVRPEDEEFEAEDGRLVKLAWDLVAEELAAIVQSAAGAKGARKLVKHPSLLLLVRFVPSSMLCGALVSLPGAAASGNLPEADDEAFEFSGDAYGAFRVADEALVVEARPVSALASLVG